MHKALAIAVCTLLALSGCKAKEALDRASIAKDLDKRGTVDLMKEVADDKYDGPADNRLTDGQIQMYLKVREHEKQIVQVARAEAQKHADAAKKAGEHSVSGMLEGFKTIGSAADMFTADIRAAKDLKYNTQEYLWVKARVLEASASVAMEQSTKTINAMADAGYQQMKKAYDEAKDEQSKAAYAQTLKEMEESRKQMQSEQAQPEPHVAYNRQLLAKYENTLNALTTELAKFEDKPGEVQKGMDDYQKQMQKAVEDAKKQ